jgi:hypothetical protein
VRDRPHRRRSAPAASPAQRERQGALLAGAPGTWNHLSRAAGEVGGGRRRVGAALHLITFAPALPQDHLITFAPARPQDHPITFDTARPAHHSPDTVTSLTVAVPWPPK